MYKARPHVYLPPDVKDALQLDSIDNTYIQFSFERNLENKGPRIVKMMSEYTRMGGQEMHIQRLTDEFVALSLELDDAYKEYKDTGDGDTFNEKRIRIEEGKRRLKEDFATIFRGSSEFTEFIDSSVELIYKEQAVELVTDIQDLKSRIDELQSLEHILNKVYKEGLVSHEQYLARKEELERRLLQQNSISNKIVNILTSDYDRGLVKENM
jgi:hypothetical protein